MSNVHKAMVLIPEKTLREIQETMVKILESLEGKENNSLSTLNGYVTEKQAQQITGKKSTTLWKLRTEGKLAFSKVGSKVYYEKASIQELLEKNKKRRF